MLLNVSARHLTNASQERHLLYVKIFIFLSLFIHFELGTEKENASEQRRGRERERGEKIPSRHLTVSAEPDVGLELMNSGIMT